MAVQAPAAGRAKPLGSGNVMCSSTPGKARTRSTPSSRKRASRSSTSRSGADAPAVTPMLRLPTS